MLIYIGSSVTGNYHVITVHKQDLHCFVITPLNARLDLLGMKRISTKITAMQSGTAMILPILPRRKQNQQGFCYQGLLGQDT